MMLKKIIIRSIVILVLAGISSAGEVQELSPRVSLCRDSVNGVFIEGQGQVLVIYGDPAGRLEKAEKVLFTDSRRDLVWAGRRLVDNGAESVVPANQVDKFAKVDDFWSAFVKNRYHDYDQQTTKILPQPLNVSRTVRGGDVIEWKDLSVRVLDTPGYSRGSVSYFV
ncbi:MAG: hypothetical protein V3T31_01965, partial [candidate division Zixibacteria bacterium]